MPIRPGVNFEIPQIDMNKPDGLSSVPGWTTYLAARCVSVSGSALTWVAMPVLVYSLTRSSAWTAAVVAMDALPYLIFGLVAGHVSDATPRRRVMVGASLVSAGALVCVPLASLAWKNPTPLLVVAAAFVVQSAFVFFDAANFGVLPSIVGRGKVTVANARLYGWTSVCEGVSPVVGGLLLVVVTPYALLWLDAASFVLCALLILRIPAGRSESRRMLVDERAPMWESIRSGIAFLWSHRLLRDTTIANLAISATNGALYSQLVIWADGHLGIRSGDPRLGLVFMALPLGAILGSFSSAWFNRLGSPRTVVGGAALVTGLAGLGAVWSSELWLALSASRRVAGGGPCGHACGGLPSPTPSTEQPREPSEHHRSNGGTGYRVSPGRSCCGHHHSGHREPRSRSLCSLRSGLAGLAPSLVRRPPGSEPVGRRKLLLMRLAAWEIAGHATPCSDQVLRTG